MGNKQRGTMKKRLLVAALAACMAFPASLPAQAAGTVHGKKVGWIQEEGQTYYCDPSTLQNVRGKWQLIGKNYYYFDQLGRLIRNKWVGNYHVGDNGALEKNKWIGKYFVGENGKWIKKFKGGWNKINKKWYYYTKEGVKKTGWLKYKGNKYYLDKNGVRLTKWQKIKNTTYYFTKKGKQRSTSWKKKGGWYYPTSTTGSVYKGERMNTGSRLTATKIEYRTSTLKVILRKHRAYSTCYWTADIKINNPNQMFSAFSYGTYGGTRETTSHAVKRTKSIIGINASAFSYSDGRPCFDAVKIQKGKIYNRAGGTSYSNCAVLWDGTMFTPEVHLSAEDLVEMGVKDSYNFGPPLIENGKKVTYNMANSANDWSLMFYKDPRSAVGMVEKGHYILLVADGRGIGGSLGLTRTEMQNIFKSYGCTYAYNMDGGGSATLAYRGTVLNHPSDGAERACGDFLLFKE